MSTQAFGRKPSIGTINNSPTAPARTTTSPPAPAAPAHGAGVEMKPNTDAIRRRAYELYLKRAADGKAGDDKLDWAQAERQLKK